MPAKPVASPDDIEMSSVLGALKKSLPKTLFMSGLLGALTYGALAMIAPFSSTWQPLDSNVPISIPR